MEPIDFLEAGVFKGLWGWVQLLYLWNLFQALVFAEPQTPTEHPTWYNPADPLQNTCRLDDQMPLIPSDVLREWSSGPLFDGWDGIQTESQIQGSAVGQGLLSSAWELYRLLLYSCSSLQWRSLPIWSSMYLLFCASLVLIWMIEKGRSFILIRL